MITQHFTIDLLNNTTPLYSELYTLCAAANINFDSIIKDVKDDLISFEGVDERQNLYLNKRKARKEK